MKMSGFSRLLLCFFLVTVFLVSTAMSDLVDFSSLTDDEVLSLLDQVNQEVVSRGLNKTAKLPQGSYVAGKDLPVGRYIFTSMAKGEDWGNLIVKSDEGKGSLLLWEVITASDEPETVFITLNKGDKLESGVPFSLTIMSGAIFQ